MENKQAPTASECRTQGGVLREICRASGRKILSQITAAREAIRVEAGQALQAREHLLRLALNEAEAIAWQTTYPHLVFPMLATEKVQTIIAWNERQQSLRRATASIAR